MGRVCITGKPSPPQPQPSKSISPMSKSHIYLKNYFINSFKSFKHLKHAHGRLYRLGLHQNTYLLDLLLQHCFGFSKTNYAQVVFRESEQPNLFLFNSMIRGLVSTDRFQDAIHYHDLMRSVGVPPNSFTFPFVLKAASRVLDLELGLKIHTLVIKLGFDDDDVYVKTSLLCLYAKCGRVEDAHRVFTDMPQRNVVSWTAIISGYIGVERFDKAVDMFKDFVDTGLKADGLTLVRVLSACSQLGDLERCEWMQKYILDSGIRTNVFVGTALIDMYAKCSSMDKARQVFDSMLEKDMVAWSAMIQGYSSNGMPQEALSVFSQMEREGLKPDCFAMVGVLSACARLGALDLGSRVTSLIDQNEILSNPVLGTALIDMYAKCGAMASAWRVFREMKERDLVVWNAAISGLAMNGQVDAAFALFGELQKLGIKPNGNTFIGLLCGCTHSGLVEEGRQFFNKMSSIFSVTPTLEHYGCMVDLLSRAGLLDDAHKMISSSMPMSANTVVWGALLSGCRLHKNTHLAETALEQLIQLEPWNAGNYVLLSNVYSTNKKWKEAEKLRLKMNDQGIQKTPGCSWIEVEGVVHEFLVGDKSHPLTAKIYAKLEDLMTQLREVGYVPITDFVLFDIEEEEKEHSLSFHSEKLAVAFGLISTPEEIVIRIVKNLRVCGDCHEAIKMISKVTGREIVVRDTNRFHCFVDGSCSCKDYW